MSISTQHLMLPYTENFLYNLDWRDTLAKIPDGTIDLFLCDPAYESLKRWEGKGTTDRMGMGAKGKGADNQKEKFFRTIPNSDLPELVQEVHRVMKDNRHAYFVCDWTTLILLHKHAIQSKVFKPTGKNGRFESCKPLISIGGVEDRVTTLEKSVSNWLKDFAQAVIQDDVKFTNTTFEENARSLLLHIGSYTDNKEEQILIWDKVVSGMGYTYRATHEFILMLWKGKKRQLNDLSIPDVLRFKRIPASQSIVPTQKPIELFETLIKQSTQPGEIVLDPFMGSGTTAIAAQRTERTARQSLTPPENRTPIRKAIRIIALTRKQ